MTYWALAAVITLASGALAAGLVAALIVLYGRRIQRRTDALPASRRALAFLVLRLAPAAAGVLAGLCFALPTFLYFEPRDTHEPISWTLLAIAVAGAVTLGRAAWRALRLWSATLALGRAWRARGRRVEAGAVLPVYALDDEFPTVAVVGFRRPAVFIANRVIETCSTDELDAMIRHEQSHVTSRDNLKRLLVRSAPAILGPVGRLEHAWSQAAEEAADASAAAGCPESRLNLAQALITIARLAEGRQPQPSPASAFYLGGSIDQRVRRLLSGGGESAIQPSPLPVVIGLTIAGAVAFSIAPVVHQLMEAAIHWLP